MRARDALKSNTCLVKCIKINPARLLCPTHTISARTSRPASRPSADFGASIYGAGQVSERPSARIMGRARPQTHQFSIHSAAARVVAVRRVESTNGRIGAVGRLWHTRLWRAKAVRIASIDVHARKSYRGSRQNSCACAPARRQLIDLGRSTGTTSANRVRRWAQGFCPYLPADIVHRSGAAVAGARAHRCFSQDLTGKKFTIFSF